MVYTIRKGKHAACPPSIGLFWDKKSISRTVLFDKSCKYLLEGEDRDDINKLFGIGYFPSHHQNSARFGWNYNKESDKINLFAYWYDGGERFFSEISKLDFDTEYFLTIKIYTDGYGFGVGTYEEVGYVEFGYYAAKSHTKKLSFLLGPYFGGNMPAPNTMKIEINKQV